MVCIYCGSKTKVTNSRSSGKGTWRRRECLECGAIVTTREQIDLEGALRVQRRDGSLEPFSRDKLFLSVHDSLSHRKSALEDAKGLTDTVLARLSELNEVGVVDIDLLADTASSVIQRYDQAAGVFYKAHNY